MESNALAAAKHGVATYETSMQLNWAKPTNFYWCKNQKGELLLLTLKEANLFCDKYKDENFVTIICEAPQMHEIAMKLPKNLENHGLIQHTGELFYLPFVFPNEQGNYVKINNLHFAEAYAKLYLKLREAGILKKEVQDDKDILD